MPAPGLPDRTDAEYQPDRRVWLWPAGLLGAAAFWLTIGIRPLIPSNIAWMQFGDASTYYLGWAFYRSEPWQVPPGASTRYGIELGNAIFFTDSVSLLAIPFKLFAFAFGPVFQYFGFWLLICFVLQGLASWLLIGRYVGSRVLKLGFVVLCLFIPVFLGRIFENGHLPLAGQFWILFALYAYGNQSLRFPTAVWALIVSGSAITQPYLMVMVGGIWIADIVRAALQRQAPAFSLLKPILIVPAAALTVMWLAGAFTLGSGLGGGGYGIYRANLLAPVDGRRWSYFWPTVPKTASEVAGTNFWGTGLLFISIVAGVLWFRGKTRLRLSRRYLPLGVVLTAMFLFALTDNLSVGPFLVDLPLHAKLEQVADVLRASERFLWPLTYAAAVLACVAVARGLRPFTCAVVVATAALLQVIDTGYGWRAMRARFDLNAPTWTTSLTSDFWKVAAVGKTKIRRVPIANALPRYELIAYYAFLNGLVTDSVYQSRVDMGKFYALRAAGNQAVMRGSYEPDTLYVLAPALVETAQRSLQGSDAIILVDDFFVVAPRWLECARCMSLSLNIVAVGRSP